MKRNLVNGLLAIIMLLFVASCGKEQSIEGGTPSEYFIKCKINGVEKTFNMGSGANKQDLGQGTLNYTVFGNATSDVSNFENFAFTLQTNIPFTATTYKSTDPTTDYFLVGIYNPNTTESDKIMMSHGDLTDPFSVTYTEIGTTALGGTFSGKMYSSGQDPLADSVIITDGKFRVKFQ